MSKNSDSSSKLEEDSPIEIVKSKNSKSSSKKTDINELINLTKKKRTFTEVEKSDDQNNEGKSSKKKKSKSKNKSKDATRIDGSEETTDERNLYPYEVVPDDHCESPIEAYQDVSSLLKLYAQNISKPIEQLFVYDPYFCEGSMKERMQSLGFQNVYNQKEDFYAKIADKSTPAYDVLVTNPPYSLQHMEKLLDFVFQSQKPFCLLVPNYVYMKDYYPRLLKQYSQNLINKQTPVFYLCPKAGRRYMYTTPKGRRQQKSSKVTSPFPTFWYCGNFRSDMIQRLQEHLRHPDSQYKDYTIATNMTQIPLEIAPDNDPRKKKLRNNLKRKKNKQRKSNSSNTNSSSTSSAQ